MTHNISMIHIKLTEEFPEETWEEIEDVIAKALYEYGVRGSLTNSITGNTTVIDDTSSLLV